MNQIKEALARRAERHEAIYARVGPKLAPFYKMFIGTREVLAAIPRLASLPPAQFQEEGPKITGMITLLMFEAAQKLYPNEPNLVDDLMTVMEMEFAAILEHGRRAG